MGLLGRAPGRRKGASVPQGCPLRASECCAVCSAVCPAVPTVIADAAMRLVCCAALRPHMLAALQASSEEVPFMGEQREAAGSVSARLASIAASEPL